MGNEWLNILPKSSQVRKKPPPILQHCRDLLVTLSEAQLSQIFLNMFDLFIQYRIVFKHNLSYSFTTELPLVLNMFLLFYILSCVFVQSYAMVLLLAHCLMKGVGGGGVHKQDLGAEYLVFGKSYQRN